MYRARRPKTKLQRDGKETRREPSGRKQRYLRNRISAQRERTGSPQRDSIIQ